MRIAMMIKEIFRKIFINKYVNKNFIRPLIKYRRILPYQYISRLPIIGSIILQNKDGISYKIETDGFDPIANLAFWSNGKGYEPGVINLLHSIGRKSEVFFDIGANTGFISIQMSLMPLAKKVYSFEPLPRAYSSLVRNIELNALKNCFTYQIAIGKNNLKSKLYVPNVFAIPSASSLDPNKYKDNYAIEVITVTLDEFVENENITNIDIIKIDVEGKEFDVLSGMKNVIQRMRPSILCEILPRIGDFGQINRFLKPYNYYIYEILDDRILFIKEPENYQRNSCRDFLLSPIKI
jgi:FkbM family methyltransferase